MAHDASHPPATTTTPRPPAGANAANLRVAVIGGSLTGPVAALLLLHAGFDRVAVYEAVPATAPQGGGLISLEHPALDILDRLGIDQREYIRYPSEHIVQITVRDRQPTTAVRRAYPGRFTTWTQLHTALTARPPHHLVHTGARVTGLTDHHGQQILSFTDGHAEPADLVIFADGRSSTGRRILDPTRSMRYRGYVAHRGTAPDLTGLSDFLRFEPGPGAQFNIAPVPGGADWTFYLNTTAGDYAALFGAPPDQRVFALPQHVSTAARLLVNHRAAQLLPPEQAAAVHVTANRMAVPMLDIDPPTQMVWPVGAGHAVLLGDALAPVRPHTAKGANNGIEQAAGLVAALTQHRGHHADLPAALGGWQRRHLPAVAAALRLGSVIGARLGLGHQPSTTDRAIAATPIGAPA